MNPCSPPSLRGGRRRRARLAAVVAVLALLVALPASASADVKVYFLQGEQLVAVDRPGTSVEDAVRAVIVGPTRAERARKLSSYLDRRTRLRSVVVDGDLATVDIAARIAYGNDGGVLTSRLSQIVYTATGVPGVTRVRVLVEGGYPLGLFPGINAADPLTRKVLQTPLVPLRPDVPDAGGGATSATRDIQQRLVALGFLPSGSVDGVMGEQTRNGIVAFQKWMRLGRDGVAGPATRRALASAARPRPRATGASRHIEVLLDRQVVLLVSGGQVARVINTSTGAGVNATPPGRYAIYRREARSWSVPFQVWLPYAAYFVGGIAFHEYPDVPPYPASHGCARLPAGEAARVFGFATMGTQVIVLARS